MRQWLCLFIVLPMLSLVCEEKAADPVPADHRFIEYPIGADEFAIIVVQEEQMSVADAKKYAILRAAEVTRNKHFKYFVIETEDQVETIRSRGTLPSEPPPPHNLYYELFQSGDFSKESEEFSTPSPEEIVPGYRVVFKCYTVKPAYPSYEACQLVPCN